MMRFTPALVLTFSLGATVLAVRAQDDTQMPTLAELQKMTARFAPAEAARLHYFLINKGPWDRLDHNRPFVPGAPAKPESANFYPAAATKEEVQKWLDSLSGDTKSAATGFFTTIRRND